MVMLNALISYQAVGGTARGGLFLDANERQKFLEVECEVNLSLVGTDCSLPVLITACSVLILAFDYELG